MKSDLEFLDSKALENMVTDLEHFNEKNFLAAWKKLDCFDIL